MFYLNLVFSSNGIPIFGCNSNFPIKVHVDICIWRVVCNPKACKVVPTLLSCKCKITNCSILIMMKSVSIWWAYLKKTNYHINCLKVVNRTAINIKDSCMLKFEIGLLEPQWAIVISCSFKKISVMWFCLILMTHQNIHTSRRDFGKNYTL